MPNFHFKDSQILPVSIENVFNFFIEPSNLERIMSQSMRVQVLQSSTAILEKGTIIDYKFRKNGISLHWQSEIVEFEKNRYFADKQTKGPFAFWYHRHIFNPIQGGTEIIDDLLFKPPLGLLGTFAYYIHIKNEIKSIFAVRKKNLESIFSLLN